MRSYKNIKPITAYRFVEIINEAVENTTSSTSNIFGISDSVNSKENDISDIFTPGEIGKIEAGGTFSAGDALTSDAEGRAIKASQGDNVGAIAEENAVIGDIVNAFVVIQRVLTQSLTE